MKYVVSTALLLALLLVVPASAADGRVTVDKNMVQTEPTVVNHPSIEVVSFLKGDWVASKPSLTGLNITAPNNQTILVSKRTLKDKKVEIEMTVLRGGSHGVSGTFRKLDDHLTPIGVPLDHNLSNYSSQSAFFSVGNKVTGRKTISYELKGPDTLIFKEQNPDGAVTQITEFTKVN